MCLDAAHALVPVINHGEPNEANQVRSWLAAAVQCIGLAVKTPQVALLPGMMMIWLATTLIMRKRDQLPQNHCN